MSLLEQKSLLAKLMATENITIRVKNVQTASFDVQKRILTVPILKKELTRDIYDLFMGHEVGHALYTPLDGFKKALDMGLNRSILNIVEDSRIERRIKSRYPGLRSPFYRAYLDLYEDNFFGTRSKNINDYNFIDRVNLHCKVGPWLNIKFNLKELELLTEVEHTESYDDVIEVTKKICDYMNNPEDKQENNESYAESGESECESQSLDEEIISETEFSYKNNESRLFSATDDVYVYGNVPKFDTKLIVDYKQFIEHVSRNSTMTVDRYKYIDYRKESSKVVSYLVKEFELRKNADQMKRTAIAKTGDLNMNKVFSYNFSEDIFKKMSVVPQGKSHGLVMFIDWSGSMLSSIEKTVKQLMNLVFFCKKVNIPFEVYLFSDATPHKMLCNYDRAEGNIAFGDFSLINILSNRMSAKDLSFASSIMLSLSVKNDSRVNFPIILNMGSTPLNESVVAALEIVPEFQKRNNIQVVNTVFLTDGGSDYIHGVIEDGKLKRDASHYVFCDPVTRAEEVWSVNEHNNVMDSTSCLIRLLKHRTNSHAIGFYVTGSVHEVDSFCKHDTIQSHNFKTKGSCVSKQTGFDDYFILNANKLDTDKKYDKFDFSVADNFIKNAKEKVDSRIVLNRFIELIV